MKKLILGSVFTVLFFFPLSGMADGDKAMGHGMDKEMSKEYTRDHSRNKAAMTSQKTVRKVQTGLNDNGYSLNVDGVFGQSTSKALKAFQNKSGIAATGRIDNDTLQALDISLGEYDRSPASIDEENPADTSSMPEPQDEPTTTESPM